MVAIGDVVDGTNVAGLVTEKTLGTRGRARPGT
jgi:hypothetical protein